MQQYPTARGLPSETDNDTDDNSCARSAILAAGTPALVAFLDACSRSTPSSSGPSLTLAAPDNPVTWDIAEDNKPIADGPRTGEGTLQLYSYADYVSPDAVKSYGDKYGVQVQISTFNEPTRRSPRSAAGTSNRHLLPATTRSAGWCRAT